MIIRDSLITIPITLNQNLLYMTKEKVYWKMRDGNFISVDDMDEEHLRNVLKIVLKNRQTVIKQIVESKRQSFTLHGDMANEFNSSHYDDDKYDDSLINL